MTTIERPKLAGMRRLLLAFVNSWKGFRGAFRSEAAFRQEVALAVVLLPLGSYSVQTGVEKGFIGRLGAVRADRGAAQYRHRDRGRPHRPGVMQLARLAKDVGSTAVLLSFAVLIVIWGVPAGGLNGLGRPHRRPSSSG